MLVVVIRGKLSAALARRLGHSRRDDQIKVCCGDAGGVPHSHAGRHYAHRACGVGTGADGPAGHYQSVYLERDQAAERESIPLSLLDGLVFGGIGPVAAVYVNRI